MTIAEIFLIFGITGTALMGAVAYLIKTLTKHFLDKDFESFKLKIRKESERDKIQYSLLQTKRANVIADFYYKFDSAQATLSNHFDFFQPADELLLEEKKKVAAEETKNFVDFYYKHKIYFDKETCILIESVIAKMKSAWIDFEFKDRITPSKPEEDLWLKAWNTISKEVPIIREKLEDSFRKILGM